MLCCCVFLYISAFVNVDCTLLNCYQIELATGKHPYSELTKVFDQMKAVIEDEPPRLPADKFSEDFRDFVSCW